MDDMIFSYALVAIDDASLVDGLNSLVTMVREHATKHDFAQMLHVGDIAISIAELENGEEEVVIVPFHREHFREMVTLNQYVKERGAECGLRLRALILPGGAGTIPFG